MNPQEHRFRDEWLIRTLGRLPAVTPAVLEGLRREKKAVVASALLQAGVVSEMDLQQVLAETHGIQCASLSLSEIEKLALSLIPEKICRQRLVLPLQLQGEQIAVAMANPLDLDAQADIRVISGRAVVAYYLPADRVDHLLDKYFDMGKVLAELIGRFDDSGAAGAKKAAVNGAAEDDSEKAPIIALGNSIIAKAVRMKASDIHIEHEEHSSVVRYRIDGVLRNVLSVPSIAAPALISRIKIMSNLDVAEHRRPQDGRAKLTVGSTQIGLRVSILPTTFGQKVVIRILDQSAAEVPFEKLGFLPQVASRIKDILSEAAQGIFLVTGPTGSGKTTTLYSILNSLRSEDTNIVTAEDPIEYRLDGINQTQVNEKQGLTFAGVLRSLLRQDPDIILVGEIRDRETADIALQAALTGHMVFSTLHTNDAIATITRLADMGVERFKMAPSFVAITAQRLVRRLCAHCRRPVGRAEGDPALIRALEQIGLAPQYFEPDGCPQCEQTGYKGRLSLIELLTFSPELKNSIAAGQDEAEIAQHARKLGLHHSMLQDALEHISAGDTSMGEVRSYIRLPDSGGPAAPAAPSRQAPQEAPLRPSAQANSVLIVDDDPAIRIILRALLEKQGYRVLQAVDGAEALQKITTEPPDLLILDLNMPNLDGRAVLKSLRVDLGILDMPVIILTSTADEKSQEEAIHLGADDYVIKPFRPALISARIGALFRRLGRQTRG